MEEVDKTISCISKYIQKELETEYTFVDFKDLISMTMALAELIQAKATIEKVKNSSFASSIIDTEKEGIMCDEIVKEFISKNY